MSFEKSGGALGAPLYNKPGRMETNSMNGPSHPSRAGAKLRGRVLVLVENLSVPRDRRVWQECGTLRRAGLEVVVICPQGSDHDTRRFELLDGVEIHRYPPSWSSGSAKSYAIEYASALRHMWIRVGRVAHDRDFDVVHACNPPDVLLLAALRLRRRGTGFVFDHHDLVPELYASRFRRKGVLYRLALALERISFRLADVVLSTNETYREVALTRGRKPSSNVFVVRNAPDLDRFRPLEPDLTLKRGRRYLFGYVGVMGPQDGVDHALRALALLKQHRHDWHAHFIGAGDCLPEMKRLASKLGLADDVEFAGWRGDDDILRMLSTCDVCLAPDPPSPLNDVSTMTKVAEYMAMSRPIVAYDLTETKAVAAGAAVYANDEAGFAQCLDELLDDPERRQTMGALGRSRVEGEFSWKYSEQTLLEAYARVLSSPRTRRGRPPRAARKD